MSSALKAAIEKGNFGNRHFQEINNKEQRVRIARNAERCTS